MPHFRPRDHLSTGHWHGHILSLDERANRQPAATKVRREGHDSGLTRRKMSAFTLQLNLCLTKGRNSIYHSKLRWSGQPGHDTQPDPRQHEQTWPCVSVSGEGRRQAVGYYAHTKILHRLPDAPDRPAMYASLLTIVRCERSPASFPLRSLFSA